MQEGCRIVWKMFIIRVGVRFCSSISSKVFFYYVKIVDISHNQCYNRINYRSQLRPKVRRIAVKLNSRRTILVGSCVFVDLHVLADVRQRYDLNSDRHL